MGALAAVVRGYVRRKLLVVGLAVVFVWFLITGLCVLVLFLALGTAGGADESVVFTSAEPGFEASADVSPARGIPSAFVSWVEAASRRYGVPMQLLAGEAMQESRWNPVAYADYGNSHAMGLMQFEPETWSGWNNPYAAIDEPDTDADRIAQYGGYGVDADGMW
ncbi:MAG: transglycosylase SLT domain-containing protein, partial [Alicyclobacillus sp.]|nr:transglycosylase SLT domain-containing protein [Alicyclobacillus sp.]